MIYTAIQKAISLINEETQRETPDCLVHRLEIEYKNPYGRIEPLTGAIKIWAEYKDEGDMDNNELVYMFSFEDFYRDFADAQRERYRKFDSSLKEAHLNDRVSWMNQDLDDCDNIPFVRIEVEGHNLSCDEFAEALSFYAAGLADNPSDKSIETTVSTYETEQLQFENAFDPEGNRFSGDDFLINRVRIN